MEIDMSKLKISSDDSNNNIDDSKNNLTNTKSHGFDVKSIGWCCVVEEDLHIGHLTGLMKIAQLYKNTDVQVKVLLDDSDYGIKPKDKQALCDNISKKICNVLESFDIKNVIFYKSSVLRNNEHFVDDFYKLISVTPEHDAAECLDKKEDIKMADLLMPVIRNLDFVYLDVQKVVHNNQKCFNLGKSISHVLNLDAPTIANVCTGTIYTFKDIKMNFFDKQSVILLSEPEKSISKKINKYFCEEGNINCKLFDIFEHLIFPFCDLKNQPVEILQQNEKSLQVKSIEELKKNFEQKQIHPCDLKASCFNHLINILAVFK